ncbi:response regulator [Sinomonas sp. P47F7]|uniref:response regulator n=1 Tax=Sinomonas sp. P47F7 TaxID=3410987 RepID=UPI003BF4DA8C
MDRDEEATGATHLRVFLLIGYGRLRAQIRHLLEHEGMEVVGEGASVREALRLLPRLRPHVAVLDSTVSDGHGIEVCRQARESVPGLGCVLLASYPDEAPEQGQVDCEFVLREIGSHRLLEAVRRAAEGAGTDPENGSPG